MIGRSLRSFSGSALCFPRSSLQRRWGHVGAAIGGQLERRGRPAGAVCGVRCRTGSKGRSSSAHLLADAPSRSSRTSGRRLHRAARILGDAAC